MCRSEMCMWALGGNSPARGNCKDEGPGLTAGYGVLHAQQEGQCGWIPVGKVGASAGGFGETERGQITGHGGDFDFILCVMAAKTCRFGT